MSQQSSEPVRSRPLSEEIAQLVTAFSDRAVTLREVMAVLGERAYTLLLVLLTLPFCTPVPIPGVSIPFGLVIALIGFRLALNKKPWLPKRLLDTRLPAAFFGRLLSAARRVIKLLEHFLRPRWVTLFDSRPVHLACGAIICASGVLLVLPLPIPLSNFFPAITVILLAAAILENDGYFVVAGIVSFVLTLGFFGLLAWGGAEFISWASDHLRSLFH